MSQTDETKKLVEKTIKAKIRSDFVDTITHHSYLVSDECLDALVEDVFKTFRISGVVM